VTHVRLSLEITS